MFEQMVADYRNGLMELENSGNNQIDTPIVQQLRQKLSAKEDELNGKFDEESRNILVNAKIDPQFVTLREELQNQVRLKERQLED